MAGLMPSSTARANDHDSLAQLTPITGNARHTSSKFHIPQLESLLQLCQGAARCSMGAEFGQMLLWPQGLWPGKVTG